MPQSRLPRPRPRARPSETMETGVEPKLSSYPLNISKPRPGDDVDEISRNTEHVNLLENKLKRLQGRCEGHEPTSNEMIRYLSETKQKYTGRAVDGPTGGGGDTYVIEDIAERGPLDAVQRKLFPHRQALTKEELDQLVEHDLLATFSAAQAEQSQSSG